MKDRTIRKNKISRIVRNNKGSTMMETLAAFVVLMVILVALTKLVSFSAELRMRAMDMNRITQEFNKVIYSNKSTYDSTTGKVTITEYKTVNGKMASGKVRGPLFYIVSPEGGELWVSDIDAYGYSYKTDDPVVSDGKLSVPKAIEFVHQKDK